MSRPRDTREAVPPWTTSRRRFVSFAGGITAALAFASRAFAKETKPPPQNAASPQDARKGSATQTRGISHRYGLAHDRATLTAESAPPDLAFVEEVSAHYVYDARSKAVPDGWTVLGSAAGGTYKLKGSTLTLPIIGNGADDWANFDEAADACAASGVTLQFGPGVYTCKTGGLGMPSNLHVVCNPLTEIACDLRIDGDAEKAPFLASGQQVTVDKEFQGDTLAFDTGVGDLRVTLSGTSSLSPGDFIVLITLKFRSAVYEVLAFDPATRVASLDRPLRLPSGSPTAMTSFPEGSLVLKVTPARNIHVEFNGARIYGKCARFIEVFSAWKCHFDGPVYCGDGTAATASERIISFDASSYDCHASRIYGDGGNVTSLGISFEAAEASTFEFCDMRNTLDAGLTFQDAVDCIAIECKCNNNRGDGAIFTAAATGGGSVLGSDHCKIVGGSYSGNGRAGIIFERGSSRCVVDGAQVLANPGSGIIDRLGNDNLVTGKTIVRGNFTGVRTEPASVRFSAANLQATDQANGIIIQPGAQAVTLTGVNANFNSAAVIVHGEADVSQLSAVSSAGNTTTQFTVTSTGVARARGLIAAQGAAPGSPSIDIAGSFDMESGLVIQQAGGIGINVKESGAVSVGPMVKVTGQGETGDGISVIDTGTAILAGSSPMIDSPKIFVAGTARTNFGMAVVGDGTTIDIAWPLLQKSDRVDVTRISGNGDYSLTLTPGTGFTIAGTPGDEFSWKIF